MRNYLHKVYKSIYSTFSLCTYDTIAVVCTVNKGKKNFMYLFLIWINIQHIAKVNIWTHQLEIVYNYWPYYNRHIILCDFWERHQEETLIKLGRPPWNEMWESIIQKTLDFIQWGCLNKMRPLTSAKYFC